MFGVRLLAWQLADGDSPLLTPPPTTTTHVSPIFSRTTATAGGHEHAAALWGLQQARLESNTQKERADAAERRAALAECTNTQRGRPPNRVHRGRSRRGHRIPNSDSERENQNDPVDCDESDGGDGEKDDDPQDVVRSAGYKYGLLYQIWFTRPTSKTFEFNVKSTYAESRRFDNIANKVQGELKEACGVLPDAYRGRNQRKKQWRWNTTNRVRHSMDTVWLHHLKGRITSGVDLRDDATRAGLADLIGGSVNAAGKKIYDVFDAPILHGDSACSFNAETFLHSELLMHASPLRETYESSRLLSESSMGQPRLSTLLRALWTLSADVLMAEKGTQTGINWKSTHDDILVYLLTGLAERRRWDRGMPKSRAWELLGDGAAAGVGRRKVLAALHEMDVVQEEPEADVEQSGRVLLESEVAPRDIGAKLHGGGRKVAWPGPVMCLKTEHLRVSINTSDG
ncbi:hypothetical protein B0H14DRAFT_2568136 [Mycena olivaceomarginata]|nr:hypothetical protein B0H14DRAFT_2568136 [Mycena olivaceomarginata]